MTSGRLHRLPRILPALMLAVLLGIGSSAVAFADQSPPDLGAGQAAYRQSCARCHGDSGRGDGLDAKRFFPRPRDFIAGVYKFRSTASGTPPTDDDLFRSVTHGLPGTNMSDWPHLDEPTRWQLVYYLKSLSPVFEHTKPVPVLVADDPGPQRADREKGYALYTQLGCAACHGSAGRANGTSAAGLVDDWGMPIRPANLTQGWSYRGGSDPRSMMLRIMTGIDGAGMPSYAEAITPEDAWHLAYYLASLQEPAHWNLIAHPSQVMGPLPETLDDPRWGSAERTDVRLRNAVNVSGEWETPQTVNVISFQTIINEEGAAFRLSWDDPSQNPPAPQSETAQADVQGPPDGFALLFKPAGSQGDVVTLQAWPYGGAPALDLVYWSAGTGAAFEQLAEDFGTVRAHHDAELVLTAVSGYAGGRWQLLLQRAFHPVLPDGAALINRDGLTSIAFAVWDGGNPTARAVSPWVELSVHQPSRQTTTHK